MLSLCFIIIFLYDMQMHFASSIESDDSLPNYDSILPFKIGLEKQLRNKFAQKRKTEERLRRINEHIAKDTEYFEDIPHFAVKSSKNIKGKDGNIQNDFKKVIGMVGVKYTYKRDLHWRTWREVTHPSKKQEVICYRCQNSVEIGKNNDTNCNRGGYWVIEDNRPLCTYEIFSFKSKKELCAAYFWQLNKANSSSCPSTISYEQLSHCDVPIVTNYVITRDYSKKVSERALPAICQGRERCDISTIYIINPGSIVFRIINTTSNIIYSRIMKHDGENYACFDDCGKFDFDTKTANRNEDHLILNLLSQSIKKKRHNHIPSAKKYENNKKVKIVYPNSKDAFKYDKSKQGAFSEKSHLFVKRSKYILEQPLHKEWSTVTSEHPSMCRQLMNDLKDDN